MNTDTLDELRRASVLADIDVQFAAFVRRFAGLDDPVLGLSAAWVSRAVRLGHTCLDLEHLAGKTVPECEPSLRLGPEYLPQELPDFRFPDLDAWRRTLEAAAASGSLSSCGDTPLILTSAHRLYLHKFWRYEQDIAAGLLRLACSPMLPASEPDLLNARLVRLFGEGSGDPDRQVLAAFAAARRRLTIISGGPGTGKTYVAARILALLCEIRMSDAGTPPPRIICAAPTGKAAARLAESVQAAKSDPGLGSEAVRLAIPETACTIHRMLHFSPGRGDYGYNARNPLPADIVLLDEASMVAVPLMAAVLRALAPGTSLILLGDMNQLASVEPGYVLGDLRKAADIGHYSTDFADEWCACTGHRLPDRLAGTGTPLSDTMVELRLSRRFAAGGAVARLIGAINGRPEEEGDTDAIAVLHDLARRPDSPIVHRVTPEILSDAAGIPIPVLRRPVIERYRSFLNATSPEEAFAAFAAFRVLCAVREGPHGVTTLNSLIENALSLVGVRERRETVERMNIRPLQITGAFYDHRPVIITANDYSLGLFNGDIGICLGVPDGKGGQDLRVYFLTDSGGVRDLAPVALPPHETAFAMTVHKSQGSEFGEVLVIVPNRDSPVLTRELLYTAISRTRGRVELWCSEARFASAVSRTGWRQSGLAEALREAEQDA